MSKNKKIAIYGVCKNEEKNIVAWYESAKNADYILLLDTGSTDKTVEIAKSLGINVYSASIYPWSETSAKNTAMALIPSDIDICICLDLDQIITTKNWYSMIQEAPDFSICNFSYSINTGYKDEVDRQQLQVTHSRNNVIWFGYRPRLKYVNAHSNDHDKIFIDIEVYHLPGDMERFNEREKLYVDSFLVEEKYTTMYSNKEYIFSVLCHIALSYFEYGNLEKFEEYYRKALLIYNQDLKYFKFVSEYKPFSFLQLAKFLTLDSGHEEFLIQCIKNKHLDQVIMPFYIRLLVVKYLKTNTLENDFNFPIPKNREEFIKNLIDLDYYEISYFLSNIEWGKSHMNLSNKLIEKIKNEK